jgi:hypothetical protein
MVIKEQIDAWKTLPIMEKVSLGYAWYIVFGIPLLVYVLCFSPLAEIWDIQRKAFYIEQETKLRDPKTRDQELAKRVVDPSYIPDDH